MTKAILYTRGGYGTYVLSINLILQILKNTQNGLLDIAWDNGNKFWEEYERSIGIII